MLPVTAGIVSYNYQTPLVNTTTPGTHVTHVPYDNVAPSVSPAQVDINTNSNNAVYLSAAEQEAVVIQQADEVGGLPFAVVLRNARAASPVSAQSAFVAQLAGQSASPETQGILRQYEKLLNYGNVKYMPSNAFKPVPAPTSTPGIAVAEPAQQAAPKLTEAATAHVVSEQVVTQTHTEAPAPRKTTGPAAQADTPEADVAQTDVIIIAPLPPRAISAYTQTASRIAGFKPNPDSPAESV